MDNAINTIVRNIELFKLVSEKNHEYRLIFKFATIHLLLYW